MMRSAVGACFGGHWEELVRAFAVHTTYTSSCSVSRAPRCSVMRIQLRIGRTVLCPHNYS